MDGKELIDTVIESANLPEASLKQELDRLIQSRGLSVNEISLDQLREIAASYLIEVLSEAKRTLR